MQSQVTVLEAALNKRHPDLMGELMTSVDVVRKAELEGELELNSLRSINSALQDKVIRLQNEAIEQETRIRSYERKTATYPFISGPETNTKFENLLVEIKDKDKELHQLKSKLALSSTNRKSFEMKENKMISDLKNELSILKTKCDLLKIENDQQKANLTGMRVEHEAKIKNLLEEQRTKVDKLADEHDREKKTILAQHASRYATSDISKLRSKVDTLQMQVCSY